MAHFELVLFSAITLEETILPVEKSFSFDKNDPYSWDTTLEWDFSWTKKLAIDYKLTINSKVVVWERMPFVTHIQSKYFVQDDALIVGDNVSKYYHKVLSDTITLDDVGKELNVYLDIVDEFDLNENNIKNASIVKFGSVSIVGIDKYNLGRTLTDTVSLTDNITKKDNSKGIVDSVSITDIISKSPNPRFTDSVGNNDFIYKGINISRVSNVEGVDSLKFGRFLNIIDSVTISDTIVKSPSIILYNTVLTSDDLAKYIGKVRGDSVIIEDNYDLDGVRNYNIIVNDLITVEDLISIFVNYIRELSDTISFSDTTVKNFTLNNIDSITCIDNLYNNNIISFESSVGLNDNSLKSLTKRVDDYVEFIDDTRFDVAVDIEDVIEVINYGEEVDVYIDADEYLESLDSISVNRFLVIEDVASFSDSIAKHLSSTILETITVEDVSLRNYNIKLTSNFNIIDTSEVGVGDSLDIYELQTVSDNISLFIEYNRVVSDIIFCSDIISKHFQLSFEENISLVDSNKSEVRLSYYVEIYTTDVNVKRLNVLFEDIISINDESNTYPHTDYFLVFDELVNITDSISKVLNISNVNVIEVLDNFKLSVEINNEDSLEIADAFDSNINLIINEGIIIEDDVENIVNKPIDNIVQIVDDYDIGIDGFVSITRVEYLYVEDDFNIEFVTSRSVEDNVTIEDELLISMNYDLQLEDNINCSDNLVKNFNSIFSDRFQTIEEFSYDREAALIPNDTVVCNETFEIRYDKFKDDLVEVGDNLVKNYWLFIRDNIYCHDAILSPEADRDYKDFCEGIGEILIPIPEVGMETEMTIKLTEFYNRTKKDVDCLVKQFFNEEDIKGKSMVQYRIYQYHILFQLVATMWLEMKWNLKDWEYFKNKYGIDNARKLAACYHIDFDMILEIFNIDKKSKYQTNIYQYEITPKKKYKYNLKEVKNFCEHYYL